ncbi:HpcH/HpaI aldolase/citrate lyase family protein [Arthrobacter castelli]|uniref:HpcH/HpaI aldolase/citrate lyase family protein n=1 Tax=Arthrobacter castelli TaxID=271431 RepID=UPI0004084F44|nr:CoA ester lyase [Arthrobacter castelli]
MHHPALTWLYCPAARLDLLEKARISEADVVIYDLEDAVLPSQKDHAREQLRNFLSHNIRSGTSIATEVHVRMNNLESRWAQADIEMLASTDEIDAVRVPKVESPDQLAAFSNKLNGFAVHALVETAKGLANLEEICGSPFIEGVSLGDADIRADMHLTGEHAMDQFRVRLVLALASQGKPAPVGSVFTDLLDTEGLLRHTRHLRDLGFIGRTALHPKQLPIIRQAFTPTPDETDQARKLLAAAAAASDNDSSGAFTMADGRFVDVPIIRQAETTMALAAAVRN